MAWASKPATPKKQLKPRAEAGTAKRILDTAIALFNHHGVQNVAVSEIAAQLEISPGNLTYHYRRKEDLVLAAFDALMQQLKLALQSPPAVLSAQRSAENLQRTLQLLWDYRFFYNAITYLLTNNRQLMQEFAEARVWVLDALTGDLQRLTEHKLFRAVRPPNSHALLAANIWALLLDWLRLAHIEAPTQAVPSGSSLHRAAMSLWSLCEPWMEPVFAQALLEEFDALQNPRPARARS